MAGFEAKAEERAKAAKQRLDSSEQRIKAQDNRLWGFVLALVNGLLGTIGKLSFTQ